METSFFQNDFLVHRGVTLAYKRGIKNFLKGTLVFKKLSTPTMGPMVPAAQASQKLLMDQDVPPSVIFHNHKWIWCRLRKLFFLSKSREMIQPWKQNNLIVREIIVKDDVIFLQRQFVQESRTKTLVKDDLVIYFWINWYFKKYFKKYFKFR